MATYYDIYDKITEYIKTKLMDVIRNECTSEDLCDVSPEYKTAFEARGSMWDNWDEITENIDNIANNLAEIRLYEYRPDEKLIDLMYQFWDTLGEHKDSVSNAKTQRWFKNHGIELSTEEIDEIWNFAENLF